MIGLLQWSAESKLSEFEYGDEASPFASAANKLANAMLSEIENK